MSDAADEVAVLLRDIGLERFDKALRQLGGTSLQFMAVLTPADLTDIGMPTDDAHSLLAAIGRATTQARVVCAPAPPLAPPGARSQPFSTLVSHIGMRQVICRFEFGYAVMS